MSEREFGREIVRVSPVELTAAAVGLLFRHYAELRRWNRRLSLVGPGTASEVILRHYGESLAALPLLGPTDVTLVDLGSGAGFPGLVIAAANSNPALRVTLVEARERKWAFLRSAIRHCGLSCQCLNARVERPLPGVLSSEIDVVTCRALALSPGILARLCARSPRARFLLWRGESVPPFPPGLAIRREIGLAGSRQRRISEVCQVES